MTRSLIFGSFLVLAACKAGDDRGSGDDDIPPPDSETSCGDNAPLVEEVWVEDGGMYEFETGQPAVPSIIVRAKPYDEDGDLTYWTMRVWFDDVVDGVIRYDERPYREVFSTIDGQDCKVFEATLGMRLGVTGNYPDAPSYGTLMEFGVVVMDDRDHKSYDGEPVITTFTTPNFDGSYPQ